MPYTPPSQQSPVASPSPTPTLSRNSSHQKLHRPIATNFVAAPRPNLPRSASSTSYLHRHRRSPSVSKPTCFGNGPATPDATPITSQFSDGEQEQGMPLKSSSLRQSPPPVNDLKIPTGAVISPPDSAQNSSDDEEHLKEARGQDYRVLEELQEVIRTIEQRRESSPNRANEEVKNARTALGLVVPTSDSVAIEESSSPVRLPLSREARKISHSRSVTESSVQLDSPNPDLDTPSRSTSESEAEDDDGPRRKPPMVRKKSGELVRPALRPSTTRRRPSSMPGTPTYSKAVHFDQHLEHVRHFLQVDRPLAVSAGSSPVEAYEGELEFPFGNNDSQPHSKSPPWQWEIRLANFPRESVDRSTMPVRVERVFLSSDNKNIVGSIAVQNLAFHKLVVARFTLDYWKTTSEVVAEFSNDIRIKQAEDGCDRFNFSIKLEDLANLESKTLFFCVRYNVNGQEFWDSNGNINYQVDFIKKALPQNGKQGTQGTTSHPLNALPRSRPSPPTSAGRPRPKSASFDDFADGLDFGSFPQPTAKAFGGAPIQFKGPKATGKIVPDAPGRRTNTPAQAFGNRYDFGASLSAAIQTAGTALGDRSGLQSANDSAFYPAKPKKPAGFAERSPQPTAPVAPKESTGKDSQTNGSLKTTAETGVSRASAQANTQKPAALTSEKPSLQSQSYHELLDKYCFFGSAKGSPQFQKPGNGQIDGVVDDVSPCSLGKASGSISPSPVPSPQIEEVRSAPALNSPRLSRSSSHAPGSGYGSRTTSPGAFGFPFRQALQHGFLGETHTPTAIRG